MPAPAIAVWAGPLETQSSEVPHWTKVERQVQLNGYICGVNLLFRTLDYPKLKRCFILVQINES
jgi:hypothetical protein